MLLERYAVRPQRRMLAVDPHIDPGVSLLVGSPGPVVAWRIEVGVIAQHAVRVQSVAHVSIFRHLIFPAGLFAHTPKSPEIDLGLIAR